MPNFVVTRPYLYVAGNIINPSQNTANETTVYSGHNLSMNETSGHTHSGATGDGPRLSTSYFDESVTEVATASPYNVAVTDKRILVLTAAGAYTVTIPNPYVTTIRSKVLTIADASGNAGTNNITITVVGYGIDTLTGAGGSAYITEDWGSITMVRLSSGYWKII